MSGSTDTPESPHRSITNHTAESSAGRITSALLSSLDNICQSCGANAILVYADALEGAELVLPAGTCPNVIYVTKNADEEAVQSSRGAQFLHVPGASLSRLGQIKIATLLALARGLIHDGDVIVFVAGLAGSGTLDTILVTEVGREFEIYTTGETRHVLPSDLQPEVLERVIDIAAELGREGREGKPVGATFVLGDTMRVLSLSRPLILNPFHGYDESARSILDPSLEETLKEFSTLDGAFLINGNGVVETCGVYLNTGSASDHDLPRGLGARHHSAAGITALSDSLAVTVSESTGTVTVFRNGQVLIEIAKPYAHGYAASRIAISAHNASL